MSWDTIVSTATRLGKAAYDLAEELGLWKRWRSWLKKKRKILVLGASGTGKSQLINSIADPLSDRLDTMQRTVAVERRLLMISGNPFIFSDTPGQLLDEAKRKVAITEAIRTQIEGVLNVACFGYHEAAEANRDDAVPTSGSQIAKADYLHQRREREESLLSEWVPLFDNQTARWVLTAVTKADLWWPDRARVEAHYTTGSYPQALGDFQGAHTVLPYCSRIEPFYGTRTSGKFGETLKLALRNHLLDSILRLCCVER